MRVAHVSARIFKKSRPSNILELARRVARFSGEIPPLRPFVGGGYLFVRRMSFDFVEITVPERGGIHLFSWYQLPWTKVYRGFSVNTPKLYYLETN